MKHRIWVSTGLMLFSLGLLVGREVCAGEAVQTHFCYDEGGGQFVNFIEPCQNTYSNDHVKSNLEEFLFTGPPSACYRSSKFGLAYEARIVYNTDPTSDDSRFHGKVIFSVLNEDEYPHSFTCGGSFFKKFRLWLSADAGTGVSPATAVSIKRHKQYKDIIVVTLTGGRGEGGFICPPPTCP